MKKNFTSAIRSLIIISLLHVSTQAFSADYYWVGGSGVWTDLTHWATSSGGGTFHAIVPTPLDNVIFDANSFSANGQTVTINFEAFCNTFTASSLGFDVNFDFNATLNSESGIDVEGVINWDHNGDINVDAGGLTLGNGLDLNLAGSSTIVGGLTLESTSTLYHNGALVITSGGLTVGVNSTLTVTGGNGSNYTGDVLIQDGGNYIHSGSVAINGNFTMEGNSDFDQLFGEMNITNGDVSLGNGSYYRHRQNYWMRIYDGTLIMDTNSEFRKDNGFIDFRVGDLIVPANATFYIGGGDKYLRDGGFKAEANSTITSLGSNGWRIYDGGFELDPAATVTHSDRIWLYSNAFGQYNIQSGGNDLRRVEIVDQTNFNTEYTLIDDFVANDGLYIYSNKFFSDGNAIDVGRFYSNSNKVMTIDLTGTPIVNVATEFRLSVNANTTFVWPTPNVTFTSTGNMTFVGGLNNTFNNLIFDATSTGGQTISIQYATDVASIVVNADGEQNVNFQNSNSDVDDFTVNYSKNTIITPQVYMDGGETFNNTFTINSSGTLKVNFRTFGNNTFNVLDIGNRIDRWEIQAGSTQSITDLKPLLGTCEQPILIFSSSLGNQGTISQASGTVTGDYLQLQDNNATGGATFSTTNTADLGNVTGWTIVPIAAVTYYWIGNNGVWSDPNNWSLMSGGAPFCAIPSRIDDVIFDVNSFSASGQFCSVDVPAECHNMTWSNITPGAGLSGSQRLDIYGSLTLDADMVNNYNGIMYFEAIDNNNTIETQGVSLFRVVIEGQNQATGVWTLIDDFTCTDYFYVNRGTFNSDGNNLDVHISSHKTVM